MCRKRTWQESGSIPGGDAEEAKKKKLFKGDDNDEVSCILLNEAEWDGLRSGARSLKRPYKSKLDGIELALLMRQTQGYIVVASAFMQDCEELVDEKPCSASAKGKKTKKGTLFTWNLQQVHPLEEVLQLDWLDANRHRNRHFKIATSMLSSKGPGDEGPCSLSLAETAGYYFRNFSTDLQDRLKSQLHKLKGKKLRLGTTCSGCDICVTVMKQTIGYFNATQDRSVVHPTLLCLCVCLERGYIYIYIYIYTVYIYIYIQRERYTYNVYIYKYYNIYIII